MTARKAALEALKRTEKGAYSTIALDNILVKAGLDDRDRALASALFYGVQENQTQLDAAIAALLRKPNQKLENDVRHILRMGIYQLGYMDRIPDSAAVDEAVKLTRQTGHNAAAGFVNGILRGYIRAGKRTPLPDRKKEPLLWLSLKYSCPMWIAELWVNAYGEEICESIMSTFSGRPPIFARVNTTRCTRRELIEKLAGEGVEAREYPILPDAVELENTGDVEQLQTYRDGLFHVQDIASQLCARAVEARRRDTVLDACAAPGGKSFTIAQTAGDDCTVIACDIHTSRVDLIESGAKRLGLASVKPRRRDASAEGSKILADRVLCDVPCSGLGVIRRKPDIKNKSRSELENLPELQYTILTANAACVKPGGRLVYSTCTLNPAENAGVFDRFLAENSGFEPVALQLPEGVKRRIEEPEHQLTLFPERDGWDGFFMAAAVRKE